MAGRLNGKAAIVTGAAGSIGLAITRAFLREGARVALFDFQPDALAAAMDEPGSDNASAHMCDVTDAGQIDKAVAEATNRHGAFDIVVNNAGISLVGGLEELTEEEWDRTFSVNVKSIFLLTRRIIPQMRARGAGSVINVASESAFIGFAAHPAYCSSKAAVVHLSRSMAARYAKDGIRTNALCPGTIDTPLYRGFLAQQADPEAVNREVVAMHPLGLGTPDDIAYAAVYLASDESRYATGAPFLIDGGSTAI